MDRDECKCKWGVTPKGGGVEGGGGGWDPDPATEQTGGRIFGLH